MALDALQMKAYFAFIEAGSLLQTVMENQLQRDGKLSFLQFFLLARLADAPDGRMRMTDLADSLVHSRSGLSYQVGTLERAGLLERIPSQQDERSVTAAITDKGRDLLGRVLPGHVEVVERGLFDPLSAEQIDAMADALDAVRDRLREIALTEAERRRANT